MDRLRRYIRCQRYFGRMLAMVMMMLSAPPPGVEERFRIYLPGWSARSLGAKVLAREPLNDVGRLQGVLHCNELPVRWPPLAGNIYRQAGSRLRHSEIQLNFGKAFLVNTAIRVRQSQSRLRCCFVPLICVTGNSMRNC